MDYFRQPQSAAQTTQNYMYQQPTSAPSNSGIYYQQMSSYPQQSSPYAMQPSVSQGSTIPSHSGMPVGIGNGRRSRNEAPPLHPVIRPIPHEDSPLRMVVDAKYVGAIIGQQGNKIREITKESKARCIVDAQKGLRDAQGLAEKVILIYGPPENASRAVVKILEVVEQEKEKEREREGAGDAGGDAEKSTDVELKLRAPNQLVGRLIGKQGSTIKKIMTETDTIVFVSKCDLSTDAHAALIPPMYADMLLGAERTITVRAPSISAVSAAEQRISAKLRQSFENDITNRMVYASTASALPIMNPLAYDPATITGMRSPVTTSFKSAKMFVPNNMVGAIIGSKGSHIRNIMRTSGAIIRIEGNEKKEEKEKRDKEEEQEEKEECEETEKKEEGADGESEEKKKEMEEPERLVTISGNDQQIYRAQYAIFAKVAEQQGHYIEEVKLRSEVNVPSRLVGRIIGKGGQNVRELQRLTGAMVKIAEENNPENKKEEEEKEDCVDSQTEETTVRVTGNMSATVGVEARVATLINDFSRNSITDRRNGSSSAGPTGVSTD